LGKAVTHYKKVEQLKNEKQPLRVQKLSMRARKRARAEEREAAEIRNVIQMRSAGECAIILNGCNVH